MKDQYSPDFILNHIAQLHHNKEDLIDGDISERVFKASSYYLTTVCPQLIDLEFNIREELIEQYNQLNPKNCPPIVLLKYGDEFYSVIDGTHRLEVFKLKNITSIFAYIGIVDTHDDNVE